jgi:aldose 1-epimerase
MATIETFGTLPSGERVDAVILDSGEGLVVTVLTFGATLQGIQLADGTHVLLGLPRLEDYLRQTAYLGATIGRYANRIAGGRFQLDGVIHDLPANDGPNTLHGGEAGFDRALWQIEQAGAADDGGAELVLSHVSPDGDQGFPGDLVAIVRFHVEGARLSMRYLATTTATTPIALTSHGYFNLAGEGTGDVLDHVLTVRAEAFLPVDGQRIPDGEPVVVAGTPFDFRTPRRLGDRIDLDHQQLEIGQGYDHCFVLDRDFEGLMLAAELADPASGRQMRIYTTEPGLQVYSGNHLDHTPEGAGYPPRSGLCLETQAFPDSPNRPDFPSPWLSPVAVWESETVLEFDAAPQPGT